MSIDSYTVRVISSIPTPFLLERMPCHISDGEPEPGAWDKPEDVDRSDEWRQEETDRAAEIQTRGLS